MRNEIFNYCSRLFSAIKSVLKERRGVPGSTEFGALQVKYLPVGILDAQGIFSVVKVTGVNQV